MPETPVKERVKQMRERRADKGLVRVEVTVHAKDADKVRIYAAELRQKREKK